MSQDIFIDTFFTQNNSQQQKRFFLQRFIREIVDIISPFGSTTEYLAHFSKYYHLGAFISVAMQNPRKLFIFSCVLNLTSSRERILKGKNWDILYW